MPQSQPEVLFEYAVSDLVCILSEGLVAVTPGMLQISFWPQNVLVQKPQATTSGPWILIPKHDEIQTSKPHQTHNMSGQFNLGNSWSSCGKGAAK